jgi:microcystin-dependent protein
MAVADPFVAEVRIFPFGFAPRGWAFADGQLLPISQNTALFSLLGTTYGGDGKTTFALPDVQGRAVIHPGQGFGLSLYDLGQEGGTETVSLLQSEIPSHPHAAMANINLANLAAPSPARSFARSSPGTAYTATTTNLTPFADGAVTPNGGDQPHNNMQPYLTLNFCIALQGVYPPRT